MKKKSTLPDMECNCNFLGKDGLIRNIYVGDQTVASLETAECELRAIISKLRSKGMKVLVLTDITKIGSMPTKVRQKGLEIVRNLDYDKVALFGNNNASTQVAKIVIKVSMMDYKIKIFSNEGDAKKWLLGS